jgi:hypothetical protein
MKYCNTNTDTEHSKYIIYTTICVADQKSLPPSSKNKINTAILAPLGALSDRTHPAINDTFLSI